MLDEILVRVCVADDRTCRFTAHKFVFYVHDTESICETRALFPSGNDDDRVAALQKSTALAEVYTDLNAHVNILHPVG